MSTLNPVSPTLAEHYLERAVRAETALRSIRRLCEESTFGGWRFKVAALVDEGLNQ